MLCQNERYNDYLSFLLIDLIAILNIRSDVSIEPCEQPDMSTAHKSRLDQPQQIHICLNQTCIYFNKQYNMYYLNSRASLGLGYSQ